jgi:hypothetical protein
MVDVAPDPAFSHQDTLTSSGWAYFYLRGTIPGETAYILLEVVSAASGTVAETLRFQFDKGYRRALDWRRRGPVDGRRAVRLSPGCVSEGGLKASPGPCWPRGAAVVG